MLTFGNTIAAAPAEAGVAPLGVGSLPGRLFEDGSVCLGEASTPSQCQKILLTLPAEIVKQNVRVMTRAGERDDFFKILGGHDEKKPEYLLSFYGIFDVDNDGDPEVFFDYCMVEPESGITEVTLLVYKKIGTTYQPYLTLRAQSLGYMPGAWFLGESPVRKAIFLTRYHGSGGGALFSLDFQKRTLHRFTGEEFLVSDDPVIADVDGDGVVEILVKGRSYAGGPRHLATLFHWKKGTFQRWWPDWTSPDVYVVDAQLVALDSSPRKAIIAVLSFPEDALGSKEDALGRELGIWTLSKGRWKRVATATLPAAEWGHFQGSPAIIQCVRTPQGATIDLAYQDQTQRGMSPSGLNLPYEGETLTCVYRQGKITCPEPGKR